MKKKTPLLVAGEENHNEPDQMQTKYIQQWL